MNWTRGLIRLWLLTSIAMTGAIGWGHWEKAETRCYWGRVSDEQLKRHKITPHYTAAESCRWAYREEAWEGAAEAGGASFALFIVGAALVWGARGFRRVDQPKSPLA